MSLKLYNTASKSIEDFQPQAEDRVTLYTCGPTVYDRPHVGNWTAYIYWDTLVRTLLASGYEVERVINITDVGHLVSDADDGEDKLEKGARREGKTAWEIAEYYTKDFLDGMEKLNLIRPQHIAKATEYIAEQLNLVRQLKEKGYTYQTRDGIYFDTAKFPGYAEFAHLDLVSQKAGARVDNNPEKRQPWDFALWKFTPDNQKRDMEWDTPSDLLENSEGPAKGFPGWHLECSAIAMRFLGNTLDIHTGGIDHIPVHHTNEIAQSEAASGEKFVNYWLHNNHLRINGGKISKSENNGYTLQDLEKKGFSPMDFRMFVLQGQFQNEGNFTFENLEAAKNRLRNWRNFAALRHQTHDRLEDDTEKNDGGEFFSSQAAAGAMREAIMNNLNTPEVMRIVDETISKVEKYPLNRIHQHGLEVILESIDELLGLKLIESTPDIDDDCKRMIIERTRAKKESDWEKSDSLRKELMSRGIKVRDMADGPIWSYLN